MQLLTTSSEGFQTSPLAVTIALIFNETVRVNAYVWIYDLGELKTHSMVPLSSATSKLASSNFRSRMSISSHSIPGLDSWCFSFICSINVDEYCKIDSSQPVGLSSKAGGRRENERRC